MIVSDFLPFINCKYRQEDGYHFNSDTVLLGMFLDNLKEKTVLDIGTAGGALLLYAESKGSLDLYGIDIDEKALSLAKNNVPNAELECISLNDFKHQEFDAIITNPPFYQKGKEERLKYHKAMDASYMPLEMIFRKSRSLLKSNGSLYMIYPAEYLNQIIKEACDHDFSCIKMTPVYDGYKKQAIRVLLKFKRGTKGECVIYKAWTIDKGMIKGEFNEKDR